MKIGIVTPAHPKSRYGNRVTALRWARILKRLGHSVTVKQSYNNERLDLLIALHARRSYSSITRFYRQHPESPIVVALTGTDLYHDLDLSSRANKSLDLATRIVALQRKALEKLSLRLRRKTRVIYQSVSGAAGNAGGVSGRVAPAATESASSPPKRSSGLDTFDVCVVGHLRPVKDPFRAALAARLLPASSRIRVVQVGGAMSRQAELKAQAEMRINPRYCWLGAQPAWRVRRVLERSRLFILSSRMEGGANALGEAIVSDTPVLASRIPGSSGILGEDYPGYFKVGDTRELARLMARAETDRAFLEDLRDRCRHLVGLFDPAREEMEWAELIDELSG
ncbi:MAG: selenoneine biosynthesis selenosugar synthase SenB [Blastocatellia bacterium]